MSNHHIALHRRVSQASIERRERLEGRSDNAVLEARQGTKTPVIPDDDDIPIIGKPPIVLGTTLSVSELCVSHQSLSLSGGSSLALAFHWHS